MSLDNSNVEEIKNVVKKSICKQLDELKNALENNEEYSKPNTRIIFGAPGTGKSFK